MAEEVIKIEQLKHFKNKYDEQVGEQLAQVNTQLDTKLDKVDPTGTGSFSLNRRADTTVGNHSVVIGYECTASGDYSHAEGYYTTTSGYASHAEGRVATASGDMSHAEGESTVAEGYYSHAEGYESKAQGRMSHAEGGATIAHRYCQHTFGECNIQEIGDTDSRGTYVEIVGNGTNPHERSNARALDWNGNERLQGTVYVNCNSDSTGGSQVVSQADIEGTGAKLYYTWDATTRTLNFFTTNPNS